MSASLEGLPNRQLCGVGIAGIATWNRGGSFAIAALAGVALGLAIFFAPAMPFASTNLELVLLCGVPIAIAVAYSTLRMWRNVQRITAFAVGAALLTVVYFATPWISDVILVLMKGPSMRGSLEAQPTRHVATLVYQTPFIDSVSKYLVFDRDDDRTEEVMKQFRETASFPKCTIEGKRIIGYYYTARVDCD